MSDTPETDALYAQMLAENPGNLIYLEEMLELACRLERERASAIRKIQRQAERIRQLEGTTNHAGGTPLSIALRERDQARADAAALADKLSGLELRSTEELARLEQERNEALAQIKELMYIGERAIALAEIDFENDKFGVVSELRDGLERIKEGAK
jgi:hypothetical protein